MLDQLIIGKTSSLDFDASVAERSIGQPKKKEIKHTIPFSNITYDFSAMNGEVYWSERELTYVLEILADSPAELEAKKARFSSWIMNVLDEDIFDPFIAEHHFRGSFSDLSFADEEDIEKTTATVKFLAYPYKIANKQKVYQKIVGGAATGCDTLTWDGYAKGLTRVERGTTGITYFKLSSVTPTLEELRGCELKFHEFSTGNSITFEQGEDFPVRDGYCIVVDNGAMVVVALENSASFSGVVFPEKGIYLLYRSEGYVESLKINGYNCFGDTLTWDGYTRDLTRANSETRKATYFKISNITPPFEQLARGCELKFFEFSTGETITLEQDENFPLNEGNVIVVDTGAMAVIALEDGAYFSDVVFPEKGIYLLYRSEGYVESLKINGGNYFSAPDEVIDVVNNSGHRLSPLIAIDGHCLIKTKNARLELLSGEYDGLWFAPGSNYFAVKNLQTYSDCSVIISFTEEVL